MNLRNLTNDELQLEAESAAKDLRVSQIRLLNVLEVVEERQAFLQYGFSSLYRYCREILFLSKGVSYELIAVINKGKEVPQIKDAVRIGVVPRSKAKKICSVISSENYMHWIELARTETSAVVEKCVV